MPTNAIYDITQSDDGIMWFATSKGIVNYNSLDWTLFADSLELPNTPNTVITPTKDGAMWVAGQNNTSFVVKYYLNNLWHEVTIDGLPKIENRFTFSVKRSRDSSYSILICTGNKAYLYDTAGNSLKQLILSNNMAFSINASGFKNNKAYIATSEGLWVLDSELHEHSLNQLITGDKEILQFCWRNEDLYLLGINWLGVYKNDAFEYLSTNTGVNTKSRYNKHNLAIDKFDRIFYSSNSSAKYFDKQSSTGKTLLINGRVLNARSNKIYLEVENNVWVGDHRGLFKFNVLRFRNFNENTGLVKDEVTSIMQYKDDIILANSDYLNILKDGAVQTKIQIGETNNMRALDIAKDVSDLVYIASGTGGLKLYDGNLIKDSNWRSQYGETGVTSVEYFNGTMFFSSNLALYTIINDKIKKEIDAIGARNLQSLNDSTLVVSTSANGLLFFNPTTGDTAWHVSAKNAYNNVYSIINWKGINYAATAGGLATFENGRINPYHIDDNISRVSIYCMLVSKNNELILGTNEGIFIWDGTTLTNYNKSYGLVGDEVNRNTLIQDDNGNIWIGTELGASMYYVDEDLKLKIKPNLHLQNVVTQKGTILDKPKQELNYTDNTIEFHFLGISFFDEDHTTYRYKLDGFDKDWIYINNPNSNSVRYTSLPPGDYKFIVESSIANTTWSDPQSLEFTINTPFYSNTWFILLTIFITLIMLYPIYRIRFSLILQI